MKNTKFNKRHLLMRIIVSPFVFALLFITHNIFVLRRFWHFLKFGGEYINFEQNENQSVSEIFKMLKEINEHNKQSK